MLFLLCLCFRIFVILDDRFSIIQFQYYHSVDKRLVIFHTEDAWLYRRPVLAGPEGAAAGGDDRDSGHAGAVGRSSSRTCAISITLSVILTTTGREQFVVM